MILILGFCNFSKLKMIFVNTSAFSENLYFEKDASYLQLFGLFAACITERHFFGNFLGRN